VTLDRPLGGTDNCSTTIGFGEQGGHATSAPIQGATCAILCFHEPGEFRYRVRGADRELSGTIVVRP
jgi:hypothetical protein